MGMTRAQKAKKYGESEGSTPAAPRRPRDPAVRPVSVHEMRPGELAPEPGKSSSAGILVGVAFFVGVALWLYYHLLVLQGVSGALAGGVTAPELLAGGFSAEHLADFARGLGTDGRTEYEGVHATTGLLTPLLTGLGWLLFTGLNTPQRARKWVYWVVVLAYAVVFLLGNSALDAAVAQPQDTAAAAYASGLVLARWILFAALLLIAVLVCVSVVRRKFDDFSRGRLPGQRPRS
ncbi:hypothetical protein RGB72_07550 [Glutamicibacter protophormiae]|uniref:Uncharacterized protein n=1 Tax=Kocuria varians TaxID=1272 RepID=A0A7D7Q444_KOCVA|nr:MULTISPECIES: hypothetical protein [Kocuria]WNB87865.1 hypothetical protein RGB72_07550 [Glutamicibacter protophormiae]MDN5632301.1 hypothetical protein [Kocuria sp.]QMS56562.1 hypothetical protein CIB50_0001274 [Kocuria varians]RUP81503.1 hypothetical protein D8M39_10705 [Kocuria sp. HSID17590]RUQ11163.1 hypothetical protein D8M38_03610 [Kocuria sp. HSID17582]